MSMNILNIFVVLSINLIKLIRSDYCEASSLIDTTKSGIFSYPIELFKYKGRSNKINNDKLFNCNSSAIGNPIFHCSHTTLACPIDSIDIEEMSRKTKEWNYKHSLCALVSKKQKNDVKRLIIFGGSVTGGRSAYGCFCLESLGNKCPYVSKAHQSEEETTESDCRWGDHVGRWFKTLFPNAKVYIINKGGITSDVMADLFENRLYEVGIKSLNNNDIVLIDHSVNDATSLRDTYATVNYNDLSLGLEIFIRRLLDYNDNGSIPSIILLEMWPFNDAGVHFSPTTIYNYSDIYYDIASAYNITLWSYHDLVWSKAIEQKYDNYTVEMLRFSKNTNLRHPPWMVHTYYADLVAGMINREMELCKNGKNNQHIQYKLPMNSTDFISPFKADFKLQCIHDIYDLLALHSHNFIRNNKTQEARIIGKYHSSPANTFPIYEDRPGKSGWINEIIYDPKDGIPLSYAARLFFTFANRDNDFSVWAWVLQISYFRSYYNVGQFEVFVCNHYLTTLDGLWEDENYFTSETKMYKHRIDPSLEISSFCFNEPISVVEIRHKFVNDKHIKKRANQKVKIVSVDICETYM